MGEVVDQRINEQEKSTADHYFQPSPGRERLLAVLKQANEIAGAPDSSEMIQGMLDLMIEVTLADSAHFFQLDPAADELVITHVRGDLESQHLVGLRLNRKQGFPGFSLGESRTMVVGDLPSDPDWLRSVDPLNAGRQRNVINLPVASKEQTIGAILIFNYRQADLDLLLVLSDRLAVEIQHRRQVESSQRSNQRLIALVDVLGEVAGTLDRNRLLHLVTENASRLVDAERSSIFLVDPETSEMVFQVAYRSPDQEVISSFLKDLAGTPASQGQTQPKREPSKKASSAVHRPNDDFSYFNRSAITVPLSSGPLAQGHVVDRDHILGGLMVLNKHNAYFQEEDAQLLRILANQASTFLQVADMYEGAGELFLGVIKALITAIDAKDPYTQGHSQRVSDYSVLISRELELDESLVNDIRIGSLLHDIGKIGIPDSILLKNGKLTVEEFKIIRRHPSTGVNILRQVKLLEPMTPAIAEHHERLDGSGYPSMLTGEEISLMGRIVAVADVFDAMTSNRPYRPALSLDEVLSYLSENAGILFDPICVNALNNILNRSSKAYEDQFSTH